MRAARRMRLALWMLLLALGVMFGRTALLPHLTLARAAEAERARLVAERATAHDRIKHGKPHAPTGRSRHLAFTPLDVDDDDEDGDDDCVPLDLDHGPATQPPRFSAVVAVSLTPVHAVQAGIVPIRPRRAQTARAPPTSAVA